MDRHRRSAATSPELIEEGFGGCNLLRFRGKVFAVSQSLGAMDVTSSRAAELEELRRKEQVCVADTIEDAKHWINGRRSRLLVRRVVSAAKGIAGRAWRWSKPASVKR